MDEMKQPQYEAPYVITYTDEEILEEIGPALTVYQGGQTAPWW